MKLCARPGCPAILFATTSGWACCKPTAAPPASIPIKAYPAATVTRLGLIQRAKKLGFSLAEIAELLTLWENHQLPVADLEARLQAKLTLIAEKIHQLEAMRTNLLQCLHRESPTCCA